MHPAISLLATGDGRRSQPGPNLESIPEPGYWYRERAINMALAMTSTDLGEVADFPDGRYRDDPAARLIASLVPWCLASPGPGDLQLAQAQLSASWRGYQRLPGLYRSNDLQLVAAPPAH